MAKVGTYGRDILDIISHKNPEPEAPDPRPNAQPWTPMPREEEEEEQPNQPENPPDQNPIWTPPVQNEEEEEEEPVPQSEDNGGEEEYTPAPNEFGYQYLPYDVYSLAPEEEEPETTPVPSPATTNPFMGNQAENNSNRGNKPESYFTPMQNNPFALPETPEPQTPSTVMLTPQTTSGNNRDDNDAFNRRVGAGEDETDFWDGNMLFPTDYGGTTIPNMPRTTPPVTADQFLGGVSNFLNPIMRNIFAPGNSNSSEDVVSPNNLSGNNPNGYVPTDYLRNNPGRPIAEYSSFGNILSDIRNGEPTVSYDDYYGTPVTSGNDNYDWGEDLYNIGDNLREPYFDAGHDAEYYEQLDRAIDDKLSDAGYSSFDEMPRDEYLDLYNEAVEELSSQGVDRQTPEELAEEIRGNNQNVFDEYAAGNDNPLVTEGTEGTTLNTQGERSSEPTNPVNATAEAQRAARDYENRFRAELEELRNTYPLNSRQLVAEAGRRVGNPFASSFDENGEFHWNYADAREGVLPEDQSVPGYDANGNPNAALLEILDSVDYLDENGMAVYKNPDGTFTQPVVKPDGNIEYVPYDASKVKSVPRYKPEDILALYVAPNAGHDGAPTWRGLDAMMDKLTPEERAGMEQLLTIFVGGGDPNRLRDGFDREYTDLTRDEYNRLAQLFYNNMPVLQELAKYGYLDSFRPDGSLVPPQQTIANFFFKAPEFAPENNGNRGAKRYNTYSGGGGGRGGGGGSRSTSKPVATQVQSSSPRRAPSPSIGGGGGYYSGNNYTPAVQPTTTTQRQNRVYNIMKNWSF